MGIHALLNQNNVVYSTFFERLESQIGQSWMNILTTPFPTDKETVNHKWLKRGPIMEEWAGQVPLARLDSDAFSITNHVFTSGIEASIDELRRDESGQLRIRTQELADDAALHPERRLTEKLEAGESTACYDGEFFFDTDHPFTKTDGTAGTQSNDITHGVTTTTAPTYEEMSQAIIKGVKQIISLKNERGLPRNQNLRQFVAMVPIGLLDSAFGATATQFVTNGVTNPIVGIRSAGFTVTVIANAYSTWTDRFLVSAASGIVKPFIFQEELQTQLRSLTMGSEQEVLHRRHVYTAERIYEIGYGRYEGACLVTLV